MFNALHGSHVLQSSTIKGLIDKRSVDKLDPNLIFLNNSIYGFYYKHALSETITEQQFFFDILKKIYSEYQDKWKTINRKESESRLYSIFASLCQRFSTKTMMPIEFYAAAFPEAETIDETRAMQYKVFICCFRSILMPSYSRS